GVGDAPGAGSTRIEGAPDWLTGFRGVARFAAVREDCNGDGRPDLHLMPLDADGAPACLVASRAAWPATLHYAALTEVAAPGDQPADDFRDLPELLDAGAAAQIRRLARLPDFNGDGLDDFAVEALVGESARPWLAVVFGAPGAPVPLELQAPAPNRALVIECPPLVFSPHHDASSVLAASGWGPLAPLGDVNGDGLGDLGLGSAPYLFGSGSAYGAVIFGRGSAGSLSLNALDGHNGFLLAWPEPGAGYARTHAARAAGDVNGDGLDDVLLRDEATGSSAVLYGRPAFAGELLTGTAAADFLVADRAGTVSAGAGDDIVRVIAAGETTVFTGLGQNTVIVDAPDGAEVSVFGGAGADRYEVQDGAVRVLLNDPDGAPNTLKLPASFDFAQLRPGLGSVLLAAGPQAPEIHLENVDFADVLGGPRSVEVIEFADGRRLSYAALIARGFDIPGTAGHDRLVGSNVVDRLRAGAGDDRLDGGAGDDTLDGGPGNDIYRFAAGSGADLLADSGGEDLLQLDDLPAVAQLGHRQSGQDLVLVRPTGETLTLADCTQTLRRAWSASRAPMAFSIACPRWSIEPRKQGNWRSFG
ncbi:MAG: hypothetical protein KGS47_17205, partial [Chloroflexi bacterium]|nr:hypothetical protein [Chloroflexota bacterium]